jgi:hypothetical protein
MWEKFTSGYFQLGSSNSSGALDSRNTNMRPNSAAAMVKQKQGRSSSKRGEDSVAVPMAGTGAHQTVCANMCSDVEYFARFIRQSIEAQTLFEHFAITCGFAEME